MENFEITCLDHVAIRVRDISTSADWYEKIFGLKKYTVKEWGSYPVFLLAGKTGIALFPLKTIHENKISQEDKVQIDHFAFQVSNGNFEKAKQKFDSLNVEYEFQDHIYFHSIYTKDPDGHTVELTTLVVNENEFYK